MSLTNESKTLFIPLYGKALMSKKGLFFCDIKAEEIIDNIDFEPSNLKQSNWLSMYMAARASIIDGTCNKHIKDNPALVIGAGVHNQSK